MKTFTLRVLEKHWPRYYVTPPDGSDVLVKPGAWFIQLIRWCWN